MYGTGLYERKFFENIAKGRVPNALMQNVMWCYEVVDRLERRHEAQAS